MQRLVEAIQQLGYYVFLDSIVDAIIQNMPFNIIDATSGVSVKFCNELDRACC
jgi:hypothetical protein